MIYIPLHQETDNSCSNKIPQNSDQNKTGIICQPFTPNPKSLILNSNT